MSVNLNRAAKSVHSILSDHRGALRELAARCDRLQRASIRLRTELPEPMGRHCRVASLSDGIAVIQTDAPIWTTRLRFYRARLLDRLRSDPDLGPLHGLRFRTVPDTDRPPAAPVPGGRVLPPAAATHLRATAESIAEPGLKSALLRLAARADP